MTWNLKLQITKIQITNFQNPNSKTQIKKTVLGILNPMDKEVFGPLGAGLI